MQDMRKPIIAVVITAIVFVITLAVAIFCRATWNAELQGLRSQVAQQQAILSAAKVEADRQVDEAIMAEADVDAERVTSDSNYIGGIVRSMTTWDSFVKYDFMRNELVDDLGLSEDSWLLSEFLPKVENVTLDDGRESNLIDDRGYNMSLYEADVRCVGRDGNTYHYLVSAVVESGYKDQTGRSDIALFVDTSNVAEISSIDGMRAYEQ